MVLFPIVVDGSMLNGSELVIKTIEASVFRTDCAMPNNPIKTNPKRPGCISMNFDLIDGRGLFITAIRIEEASTTRGGREEESAYRVH